MPADLGRYALVSLAEMDPKTCATHGVRLNPAVAIFTDGAIVFPAQHGFLGHSDSD